MFTSEHHRRNQQTSLSPEKVAKKELHPQVIQFVEISHNFHFPVSIYLSLSSSFLQKLLPNQILTQASAIDTKEQETNETKLLTIEDKESLRKYQEETSFFQKLLPNQIQAQASANDTKHKETKETMLLTTEDKEPLRANNDETIPAPNSNQTKQRKLSKETSSELTTTIVEVLESSSPLPQMLETLTIEEKTHLLEELDPNNQVFVNIPDVNAGNFKTSYLY